MVLGTRKHTAGNTRRWYVDYSEWLDRGHVPTSFAGVSSSSTLTVSAFTILSEGRCSFLTAGGLAGETATVTVTMHDNNGQIKVDECMFMVVAA